MALLNKFWVHHRPQFFESIHITRGLLAYPAKSLCSCLFGTDGKRSWEAQRGDPVLINRVDVFSRPWIIISHSLVGFSQLILFATFTIYTGDQDIWLRRQAQSVSLHKV
ncbi:hypothetical protein K443DRAFT_94139 [Laccaria amethystina LaAM-08-1]|uniref:Uncharacterized protein n=1 Tax=Laccaria amethystina LaAM-08-1 TaxID=1095629 RepID=A0A0C9WWE5_9AGAR|nr:hypothetical protein K443DRAFT_94139 [Laccaria amethystina LaAM-08-1]